MLVRSDSLPLPRGDDIARQLEHDIEYDEDRRDISELLEHHRPIHLLHQPQYQPRTDPELHKEHPDFFPYQHIL